MPLTPNVEEWITHRWGIYDPQHWYYTTDKGGRIAMSVRAPNDTHRGWVLRSDGSVAPKALTYLDEGAIGLSWYKAFEDGPTVLVEDIPSAIRASAYVNAVALMGTECGLEKAMEIRNNATYPVVVALDQDATKKAADHVTHYQLLWRAPRLLPLQKDIKDMKEPAVCQLLTTIRS